MSPIEAVISGFGGVLTSPLLDSFAAFQDSSGVSLKELTLADPDGALPFAGLRTLWATDSQGKLILSMSLLYACNTAGGIAGAYVYAHHYAIYR